MKITTSSNITHDIAPAFQFCAHAHLFSFTKSLLSDSTIIHGEGMVMMQAKQQTLLSSQWSMLGWLHTTLTIWASKPSWRLQASRQPRPWSKARMDSRQELRGRRRRNKNIKKRQMGRKCRRQRKRRNRTLMLCLRVSVGLTDQCLIATKILELTLGKMQFYFYKLFNAKLYFSRQRLVTYFWVTWL